MAEYRLPAEAGRDIERIFEFGLDCFGYEQASRYLDGLEVHLNSLARYPKHYPAMHEVVTKSIKALNHKAHKGHKGKALLCALCDSLLFRAFCDTLLCESIDGLQDSRPVPITQSTNTEYLFFQLRFILHPIK